MKISPFIPAIITSTTYKALPEPGRRYTRFAARETCAARDEIWMTWLMNLGCQSIIDIPNKNIYDYYIEQQSSLRALKRLAQWMERNWDEHRTLYAARKRMVLRVAQALSRTVMTKDPMRILQAYVRLLDAMYVFGEYIFGAWAVIYHIEPIILKMAADHLELIMALEQPIGYLRMKRDAFRLSAGDVVKQYAWLNVYNPYDTPYTVADIRALKKETSSREIEEEFKRFSKTRQQFHSLLASVGSRDLQMDLRIVHAYAWLKTDRIDVWRQAMFLARPFFEYIAANEPSYTLRDACNLFRSEIQRALREGVFPLQRDIQRRSANDALYYYHHGVIDVVYSKRLITNTLKHLEGTSLNTGTLKGISACKGHARGRVVVVTHSDDLRKVRDGDIFVAKYTFPSFTPCMLKCAAVVTDEGGITGHAAIVSREYNKPCIIATQRATRVFKDGDMVEVDALRGIITLLKN